MRVLVVNAGSSSLKHALVDVRHDAILTGGTERWNPDDHEPGRHATALASALADAGTRADAVGHRVVHGGGRFTDPVLVDDAVRAAIAGLAPLDPLHTRAALEGIDAARATLPGLPEVACFDTAFHDRLPPAAATYALPREWTHRHGLRRYGFHGLNAQWCHERATLRLGAAASRRLVVCHLGSGCSVTAVLDGRSIDTTMGFTPLEGVPMATRSGSVDPGLLLHLLARGMSLAELDDGLNHASGLLGVSGLGGGVQAVEQAADAGDEDAALAFAILVRGVAGAIGSMSAALAGLDALVFTAGAGEGSPKLRATVCERLGQLGVSLDPERNATAGERSGTAGEGSGKVGERSGTAGERSGKAGEEREIGAAGARVRTLVVHAGEEIVIARATAAAVSGTPMGAAVSGKPTAAAVLGKPTAVGVPGTSRPHRPTSTSGVETPLLVA
jgi:acetate kinase